MLERYGGLAFISRLVLSFYDRALASVRLAPFFTDVDMQRLVEHQTRFIASVMGEPESHTDAMLRDAHANLQIDDGAFDEMVHLLELTLEEFHIASSDIGTIVAALDARRQQIVCPRSES